MEVSNRDFIVFSVRLCNCFWILLAFAYDQFHEMFRHTGLESFGVTLLEANYISSDVDRPIAHRRGMKSVPPRGSVGSPHPSTTLWIEGAC
jgi:hypothetical protein